jgi:UDP-2,3-diacylglucosamine pyrophosphatase LpxH
MQRQYHRAIFLSDFHLGSRLAKADELLSFLASHDADTWYLVGDIVDLKRLRRRHFWPRSHARVLRVLRQKARAGGRLVYLPGNHDPDLHGRTGVRRYLPGIEVVPHTVHETAQGRRLLVIHGDRQEPHLPRASAKYVAGCTAYILGVGASELVGRGRAAVGLGYWSLSAALKDRVLPRVDLIARYRANLLHEARRHGCDGVVCGHIHHAGAEVDDGVLYVNCGDWVDSCTAVVESPEGELSLVRWAGVPDTAPAARRAFRPEPLPAW